MVKWLKTGISLMEQSCEIKTGALTVSIVTGIMTPPNN